MEARLGQPVARPRAQHDPDAQRQDERRQQAERERPPHDFRDLGDLVDVPADRKNFAARQRTAAEHANLQKEAGLEPLGSIPTRSPISLVEAAVPL